MTLLLCQRKNWFYYTLIDDLVRITGVFGETLNVFDLKSQLNFLTERFKSHPLRFSFPLSGIRAYEQLGYRAFGTPGKMAAGIAITLQNIGGESSHDCWLI